MGFGLGSWIISKWSLKEERKLGVFWWLLEQVSRYESFILGDFKTKLWSLRFPLVLVLIIE